MLFRQLVETSRVLDLPELLKLHGRVMLLDVGAEEQGCDGCVAACEGFANRCSRD